MTMTRDDAANRPAGDMIVSSFAGGAFQQNSYLLRCRETGHAVVVDPGPAIPALIAEVERAGATVDAILLTHAHLDHVEGLPQAKEAWDVPILLHPDDRPLFEQVPTQAEWFGMSVGEMPPIEGDLLEGVPVTFGRCVLEVRHTPGHAPGHIILVGDGEAITADTVFAGSIGRTDLPGGNATVLLKSIREKILSLPDETVLHTGHGPSTTVGHERVTNPFLVSSFGGSLA